MLRIFFVVLMLMVSAASAQIVDTAWVWHYYGQDPGPTDLKAVTLDRDGNICITGRTLEPSGYSSIITAKIAPNGIEVWISFVSSTVGTDGGQAIAVDSLGYVYVAAPMSNAHDRDYSVLKFDFDGALLWECSYGGSAAGYDWPTAIAVDPFGNVFVTGESTDQDTIHGLPYANDNMVTIKVSNTGQLLWAQQRDGTSQTRDKGVAVFADNAGNCVAVGTLAEPGGDQMITIKYAPDGTRLWSRQFVGVAADAAMDADGNVYSLTSTLIKYDSDGNQIWTRPFASTTLTDEAPASVAVGQDGQVAACGSGMAATGHRDFFTMAVSSENVLLFEATYDGPASAISDRDEATAVAFGRDGTVYTSGLSYDVTRGYEWATVKSTPFGGQLWVRRYSYGAPTDADLPRDIAVNQSTNDVYVAGGGVRYASLASYHQTDCKGLHGNVDCDLLDIASITDLQMLVDFLFGLSSLPLPCPVEADFDGSTSVDIADLNSFVDYMFYDVPLTPCP